MKNKKLMKTQTLKGFRDFLPTEASKRLWLKEKLRKIFKQWGYDPLETPTLEPLKIFKGEIGEGESLFYKFKDLGGREVALRYDQTVPTCRVVGQYFNRLTMPFKRYQIQPAFRAEKPQKGRYREFVQCDADIFGTKSPYADAEVIALGLDIYRQLGFKKVTAFINNRDLLKKIPYKALASIDKIKKIGSKGVLEEMQKKGITQIEAKKYLNQIKKTKPDETIKIILKYLENMGFDKSWYKFDPTITRSFSYSNGPVWEIEIPEFKGGSVLGGERFDKLTKNITGVDVPATGFGLGFDRTLEAAEQFNLIPASQATAQILVTVFSSNLMRMSIKTTVALRKAKINTELYPNTQTKLPKQFKYADKKGIPYVAVIGPDEKKNKKITLKDMKKQKQETITLQKLIKKLSG